MVATGRTSTCFLLTQNSSLYAKWRPPKGCESLVSINNRHYRSLYGTLSLRRLYVLPLPLCYREIWYTCMPRAFVDNYNYSPGTRPYYVNNSQGRFSITSNSNGGSNFCTVSTAFCTRRSNEFVGWLVRSFVLSFVTLVVTSRKVKVWLTWNLAQNDVRHLCRISLFQRSRSKIEVRTVVLKVFHF